MMGRKDRILLITYPFAGIGANMIRYQSFATFLTMQGYDVDVIGYFTLNQKLPIGISYYQIRKSLSLKSSFIFLKLFVNYLYLLKVQSLKEYALRVGLAATTYSMSIDLIKRKQYESCLVGIHPWAFYLMVPLLRRHIRTVLDIGDPLYKNAITKNSSHPANLKLEKHALDTADYVITMNEPTIEIMKREMGITMSKVEFITPAMKIDSYCRNVMKSFTLHNPLQIIYSGSLYQEYRDLSEVQPAIEMRGDIVLDVFTNNNLDYESTCCVRYYDWITHDDLLRRYQEYDIILFVDNAYGYQVPSKIFEIIAQNKPILFVYDQRNTYFYDLLQGQKGIFFVENKRERIVETLKEITRKQTIETCFDFDMSDYSEDVVNMKLLASLTN